MQHKSVTYASIVAMGETMTPCAFDKLLIKNIPHILEKIFFSLDYESFKACLGVSRNWNYLLKSESFQKRAKPLLHSHILEDEKKLHIASRSGNTDEVKRLISGGLLDVNSIWAWEKTTALFKAALNGHTDTFCALLLHGAIEKGEFGENLLHLAAKSWHKDIVEFLINNGWDTNKKAFKGRTPLHFAAFYVRGDVVQLLLDRGADPNMTDRKGRTPLHQAVFKGYIDVVQLLIDGGSNPSMANINGWTPLHIAEQNGRRDMVNVLKYGVSDKLAYIPVVMLISMLYLFHLILPKVFNFMN